MPTTTQTLHPAPLDIRTFGLSWPLLVALIAIVGVLLLASPHALLNDPDTFWHLAAGRWILEHGTVPTGDPFSSSMPGSTWTIQSWLTEVVFASVFQMGGWRGLVVLGALCFGATLAFLTRFLLVRLEPVHALLFVGFAASLLLTHLSARPHVLIWPLFAVWIGVQVDASEQKRSPPWWLLVVMFAWANLHGSFTLGLALSGGLAVDAIAARQPKERWSAATHWGVFVLLAILVSMLTPNGWQGIWYTVQVMQQDFAQSVIVEWQSPNFHRPQGFEIWLALMLALGWSGKVKLPLMRILLLLGLVHLALVSGRSISTLGLVSPFLLAAPLARHWYSTESLTPGGDVEQLDRWFRALAAPAKPITLFVALLIATVLVATVLPSRSISPGRGTSPERALDAAKAAGVTGEVLNDYGFGGYLIYRDVKVFIDGRSDLYGDAFMKRYFDAVLLKDSLVLPALLAESRIGWTLLTPGTPAIAMLDQMPGWRRVFADDMAVVHMRLAPPAAR